MKNIIQWLLCLLPIAAAAQEKGVKFQHGLSWEQVQAKAKAEKKYIFIFVDDHIYYYHGGNY